MREVSGEKAKDSEHRVQEIARNSGEWIWEVDVNGKYIFSNSVVKDLLGYTPEEIIGKKYFYDFFLPRDRARLKKAALLGFKKKAVMRDFLNWNVSKDGKKVLHLTNAYPILDADKNLIGYRGVDRDITREKMAEDALKKSEEKYRSLIDNIPDVVWTTDADGKTIFISPNVKDVYGYTSDEIYKNGSKLWFGRIHKDDIGVVEKAFADFFAKGEKYSVEYRIKRKDGSWMWLHDRSIGVYERDGKKYADGVFSDVTKKKNAEQTMLREKRRAENYLNITGNIIVTLDNDGNITLLNKKGYETVEYPEGSLIGKNWMKLFIPKKEVGKIKEVHRANVEQPKKFLESFENEIVTKSGKHLIISWHNSLIKDSLGKVIGTLSSGEDVTEKRKAERNLEKLRAYLDLQIERMPIGLIVWDSEFRVTSWNPAAAKIFGFSEKEAMGKHPYEFLVPESAQPAIDKIWTRLLRGDETAHSINENIAKNGKTIVCSWSNTPLKTEDGKILGVLAMVQDITEKKKVEDEVKRLNKQLEYKAEMSEEKYKTLYESSTDAIMILEPPTWKFTAGNLAAINMFGVEDEKQFITLGPWDISPKYQINKKASSMESKVAIMKAMKEGSNFFKWTHKKLSGEEFPATVLLTRTRLGGKDVLQATVRDISDIEKREEELEKANSELKQLDVAKSDFLNMISHELKTPLTAMMAHLDVLGEAKRECISRGTDQAQCGLSFDAIKRNNNQLNFLIDNLLEVARIQAKTFKLDPTKVDIRKLTLEVIANLLPFATQKKLKIYHSIGKNVSLRADENRMREILNNLINNAIKFTKEGKITVRVRSAKDFVSISVEDSGVGIKKEDMPNLFKKFFQVEHGLRRGVARGTGLGLTIVNKLSHLHGGKVFVRSQFGKGSTFTVKLPVKGPVVKRVVKKKIVPVAKKKTVAKRIVKESSKNHHSNFIVPKNMKGGIN